MILNQFIHFQKIIFQGPKMSVCQFLKTNKETNKAKTKQNKNKQKQKKRKNSNVKKK